MRMTAVLKGSLAIAAMSLWFDPSVAAPGGVQHAKHAVDDGPDVDCSKASGVAHGSNTCLIDVKVVWKDSSNTCELYVNNGSVHTVKGHTHVVWNLIVPQDDGRTYAFDDNPTVRAIALKNDAKFGKANRISDKTFEWTLKTRDTQGYYIFVSWTQGQAAGICDVNDPIIANDS